MSSLNGTDILITFDELKTLDVDDISACVDIYSALNICKKSSASPSEIYYLWIQKLLKAYDLKEFSSECWQDIINYLRDVLNRFVANLESSKKIASQQINQWWVDTKDLLIWLTTVINAIGPYTKLLMMILAVEVVIKTCPFVSNRNPLVIDGVIKLFSKATYDIVVFVYKKSEVKLLLALQQLIVKLANNYLTEMSIDKIPEFTCFNKFMSAVCDTANLISKYDIKTSVETWRTVAKLSEKYVILKNLPAFKMVDTDNWHLKAILGIFKELNLLIKMFKQKTDNTNESLLQLCQFYLKILKLFINQSGYKLNNFPNIIMNSLMEFYTLCQHDLSSMDKKSKINSFLKKGFIDIYSMIYKENYMIKLILQHLTHDNNNCDSCDLVFDTLKLWINGCQQKNENLDIPFLLRVYNDLLKGSLIFIDGDKYNKVLENYAALCILDSSKELHKEMCEYIIDSTSWIRAYTSMDILSVYYSFIFKGKNSDDSKKLCVQYWFNIWNKLNKSTETFKNQKNLVQVLLKTIIMNTDDYVLQNFCNKFENFEIILLLCGKSNDDLKQYFQTNLGKLLAKLQEKRINKLAYNELLNLLEIGVLAPELFNNALNVSLFETFISLFCLTKTEFTKFSAFFNKSLRTFYLQKDQKLNEKLIIQLTQYVQHCCSIHSAVLIEFLLTQRPQSNKLLQILQTEDSMFTQLIKLMSYTNLQSADELIIDPKIFQDIIKQEQTTNTIEIDVEQINKRPRLDKTEDHCLNVKIILKDMKLNSTNLASMKQSSFDEEDFESLNEIKSNIEKCLTNRI